MRSVVVQAADSCNLVRFRSSTHSPAVPKGNSRGTATRMAQTEIENAVYLTGLPALSADLVTFVNILANGGKPFDADAQSSGDATGEA